MAELLTKIPTSVTEYPKSFKRQGCFPLEAYSVFYATADKTAFEAAQAYASTNAIAYVGQTLAVVTTNAEDATVVDNVTFYIIADAAGTLQEVGKATNGDGKSIVLNDGILSLAGFEAAQAATLPQKQVDGTIKWVPIDSIVEGDTNTKTVVAAGDEEAHVSIELVRDDETDTNTYKISLDLSAYALAEDVADAISGAKTELEGELTAAVTELDGKITAETQARVAAIGAPAAEGSEASGVYAAIAAAEASAKAYADANDADTIYNDAEVRSLIEGVSDRVTDLEGLLGDETDGLVKDIADNTQAIADEADAREQGDEETLDAAKDYTDTEIAGLALAIEKKDNVDYIVIKNNDGEEVASVDASAFVKDSFLENVVYEPTTGDITFSFVDNTDNKSDIVINVKDLVDTYTAGTGLKVENNEFSVDTTVIATVEALNAVSAVADAAQTADEVSAAIDAKIAAENLSQYAVKATVEADLAKKLDADTYNAEKETFALKTDVETGLAGKVDNDTLNNYYTKTEVDGKGYAVASEVAETYATKKELTDSEASTAETLKDYAKTSEVAETLAGYYTKGEVYTKGETDNKIDAKIASVTGGESAADVKSALESYRDAINQEIWGADAGSWTTTVDEDGKTKVVYTPQYGEVSRIDTLASEVETIKTKNGTQDTAIANNTAAIGTNTDNIAALVTKTDNTNTAVALVADRVTALETADTNTNARIDALNTVLNGAGETTGLIATVAGHTTAISGLQSKDNELAGLIAENTAKFGDYYTKTTIDGKVTAIEQAIANVDLSSRVAVTDFNEYKEATAATIATLAVADTVNAALDLKADKTAVETIATDLAGEIARATAAEQKIADDLALLIDNPTEALDSVKEIIDHVKNHGTAVEGIITRLDGHDTAIAANKAAHEKNASDIVAINALIAANEVKESAEISVTAVEGEGATGVQLGVKEVNVNKLVQTAGDTLILNGGSATVQATA